MKRWFFLGMLMINVMGFTQITVNNNQTAQDLAQLLFNNSGCATISNFSVTGNNSYGSFNRNGSSFPFDEGIVLSTGFANHVPGPNNNLSSDDIATATDPDIEALFAPTYDATILEFDFIPETSYISFEYLFASEEYQENNSNTCVYSDVFAFLIKANSATNYTNIALVPNTDIPVQVTTVHPDVTSSCQAENEAYFGSWNSQSDSSVPINFNGQTSVLKAESTVIPNQLYHIKLVIADHTNYQYDSAVFLRAGSFNVGTDLGIDRLRSTKNPLCGLETIILDCNYPAATSYSWFVDEIPYDGIFTPISGANAQTYEVVSEGRYKVAVDLGSGCISEGQISIEFDDLPIVVDSDLIGCNDDLSDFYEFDLSDINNEVTNNSSGLFVENYYHLLNDANNQLNPIGNYYAYTNQVLDEEIFVRIENQAGCASIAKVTLKVFHNPKILDNEEVFYCLNVFPEMLVLDSGLQYADPANFNYTWTYNNGIDAPLDLAINSATIAINQVGIYTVDIESIDGCVVSREITVVNSNIATITNVIVSESLSPSRISIQIEVSGEGDYQYAVDDYAFQDSPIFDFLLYGTHIITVKDKNGCLPNTQKEITILSYPTFLSPNSDGVYDTWNLDNPNDLLLHFNTVSDITIYNRYGKIMAVINPKGTGWNGYYNGVLALPEDYWFSVDLIDFKGRVTTKQGHFSLIR
jgi:gliding motility-associated-like protein